MFSVATRTEGCPEAARAPCGPSASPALDTVQSSCQIRTPHITYAPEVPVALFCNKLPPTATVRAGPPRVRRNEFLTQIAAPAPQKLKPQRIHWRFGSESRNDFAGQPDRRRPAPAHSQAVRHQNDTPMEGQT